MSDLLTAFLASSFFITAAEMGDKTQLVALSFACRYRPSQVLGGVFAATLVVHFFSVIIGQEVSRFIPLFYMNILVGASFIGFGLWTLKPERATDECRETGRFGPLVTVGIAFFLAELGDKTQLATISLAARYHSFTGVWLGSTLGMVVADGLAIGVGVVAGKRLPERVIRYVSAAIFIVFGIITIIEALI